MPFTADFQFSYDPALFSEPPPIVPSSAELFSATETSDIFGFLDNFSSWDFDADAFAGVPAPPRQLDGLSLPSDGLFGTKVFPELDASLATKRPLSSSSSSVTTDVTPPGRAHPYSRTRRRRSSSPQAQRASASASVSTYVSPHASTQPVPAPQTSSGSSRSSKPLLTDPQKRMNHIMSEQKRRNAIREGYAQLTALLAPAGAPPGTGMPTRGRPKGSGARGKASGARSCAGKSGVLLRAVEYCRWLEEGRDALLAEVKHVESILGVRDMDRLH